MRRFFRALLCFMICASFLTALPFAEATYTEDAPVYAASVYLNGDVNGDGIVSTDDAIFALKISMGIVSCTSDEKTRADMDKDGVISTEDARLVLVASMNPMTDEEYVEYLVDSGFPKSYTDYLLALHKKYPRWKFQPFITGLTWSAAVNGERTPHNKQLIENNVQSSFKCTCSSCNGVIQESPNWVSASQTAVEYYMDPRNFLNEQYIFQFESTEYDPAQSIGAVEAIISSTWMHNSYITYLDAQGNTVTYLENEQPVKYSEAILRAAKENNVSAYYLASKIVQEVGSTSASNAGGSKGTCSPYNGIYNYYNIGAYTGAMDGLDWANGYMKTGMDANLYANASTSNKLCTVPSGTSLYYCGEANGFYKVTATVSGTSYTGYVAKSTVSAKTTYGRPWDNPYKSIYYGAQYIYENFSKFQFTGYLQKFNVNVNSGELYYHEYMANVRAAASESYHTYKAYVDSDIIDMEKVFSIPVFINMPGGDLTALERFQSTAPIAEFDSSTAGSVTIGWGAVENAQGYQIYKVNNGTATFLKAVTATSYTDTTVSSGQSATYKVRAYQKQSDGTYVYSQFSPEISVVASPGVPTDLKVTSKTETTVSLSWTAVSCDGYNIYRTDSISGGYALVGTVTTNSFTDKNLLSGVKYTYKIKAYHSVGGNNSASDYSSAVSATTNGTAVSKIGTVKVSDALNIRASASTSGNVITTLPNGHKVYIIETLSGWYKVTFISNGAVYTGYASSDYMTVSDITSSSDCPYSEPTVTVRQGDSGNNVKWVQWHLAQLGYLSTSGVDGSFGSGTLAAVKQFQTDKGLTVDGLVGSGTRTALKNAVGG